MFLNDTNLIRHVRFEADGTGGPGPDAKGSGTIEPTKPFMAQLEDPLKQDPDIAALDGFNALARGYKELKSKVGGIELPPETPAEYELDAPKMPEGYEEDIDVQKAFREFAKNNNFTKPQAKEAYTWFNKLIADQFSQAQEAAKALREARLAELKKTWAGEYDAKLELMKRAYKTFGGEEFQKLIDTTGIGNHPAMIETFVKIAEKIGEDQLEPGDVKDDATGREGFLNTLYPSMKDMPARNNF